MEKKVPIAIRWQNIVYYEGFRADLLVERKVVVEWKSVEKTAPAHKKARSLTCGSPTAGWAVVGQFDRTGFSVQASILPASAA